MKTKKNLLVTFLFLLLVSSCMNEKDNFSQENTQDLEILIKKTNHFYDYYTIVMDDSPIGLLPYVYAELNPERLDIQLEAASIAMADAHGFVAGFRSKPYSSIKVKLAVGLFGGALMSIKEGTTDKEKDPEQPGDGFILYDYGVRGINYKYPINNYYLEDYYQHPILRVGAEHNIIINQLYAEDNSLFEREISEDVFYRLAEYVLDILYEEGEDFDYYEIQYNIEEDLVTLANEPLTDFFAIMGNKYGLELEMEVIDIYFKNASKISHILDKSYTDQFLQAVYNSSLEEESKQLVAGAISVAANSSRLWNYAHKIPYGQFPNLSVFISNHGEWTIMERDRLIMQISSGECGIFGIPDIFNGKISSIYFFQEQYQEYCSPFYEESNYFVLNENLEIFNYSNIYGGMNFYIDRGEYPVYTNEERTIFKIDFEP